MPSGPTGSSPITQVRVVARRRQELHRPCPSAGRHARVGARRGRLPRIPRAGLGGARRVRPVAGGGRALRRGDQRRRRRGPAARPSYSRHLARPAPPPRAARSRSRVAPRPRRRRYAGTGARGRAGLPRADARSLPAELRVRHDRRLCGDPLRWAGLERIRPHRRARLRSADGRSVRRARPGRAAGERRRPGSAAS